MPLHITLTDKLEDWLKTLLQNQNFPNQLKTQISSFIDQKNSDSSILESSESSDDIKEHGISFSLLKEAYNWQKQEIKSNNVFLHELCAGSRFFNPPPPVVEKDPELVARLEKMKFQIENRIYAKMVENVSTDWKESARIQERADLKTGLDTAKMAFNLLASVASVFAAVYFVFHLTFHNVIWSISAGTAGAIIIFMVEVLLFVMRGSRLDARVAKEREDYQVGLISPFGPVAPSILEASKKKRKTNIKSLGDNVDQQVDSLTFEQDKNEQFKNQQNLIDDETTSSSTRDQTTREHTTQHSTTKKEEIIDHLSMTKMTAGGSILEDD